MYWLQINKPTHSDGGGVFQMWLPWCSRLLLIWIKVNLCYYRYWIFRRPSILLIMIYCFTGCLRRLEWAVMCFSGSDRTSSVDLNPFNYQRVISKTFCHMWSFTGLRAGPHSIHIIYSRHWSTHKFILIETPLLRRSYSNSWKLLTHRLW